MFKATLRCINDPRIPHECLRPCVFTVFGNYGKPAVGSKIQTRCIFLNGNGFAEVMAVEEVA